ncbi:TadE family type IV pilus minor pilin [Subtercola sp. RTI3]|uniref:TadE family type IV pilus minor pilin n=1 Tax=Subtercola sp. RTI3 TaxID=3048639 RepID=UPI002B231101|nr:TadE family type IV pilus minor pilin [Subtercola sp. RTI3]MEA9986943.1 TadE family type IV pilus minor pilin [Subtercola sp. RTI3]
MHRLRLRALVRDDRGMVTAELAAALPAVVLVLVLALGALQASGLQVRVVDAAAVAARSLGRGDSPGDAEGRVTALIGPHELSSGVDGEFVCVRVAAPVVFVAGRVLGLEVSARSCALTGGR